MFERTISVSILGDTVDEGDGTVVLNLSNVDHGVIGDPQAVGTILDDHGLRRHELFSQVLQSIIELAEPGSEERSLLESLSNHIGAKGAKRQDPQRSFAFEGEEA